MFRLPAIQMRFWLFAGTRLVGDRANIGDQDERNWGGGGGGRVPTGITKVGSSITRPGT